MKSKTIKYGALFIVIALAFAVIVKSLLCETYEDVIHTSPGRSCPPPGYERGQCPDPNTYDWTKGECSWVEEGPPDLRLRWNGNLSMCACIPNDWEPESAHKLVDVMKKNPHFQ